MENNMTNAVNTVVPEVQTEETTYGMVICKRLNVRKKPVMADNIVCVIEEGTEVNVDLKTSTEEFYKVESVDEEVDKFYGYCMKKFISVL